MMPERDWVDRWLSEAKACGDQRRLRLAGIVYDVDNLRETHPERALALIDEARALAREMDEPWWALFYDDRRSGLLMKYLGDARTGLEQAVRNVLTLRSPTYERFPWRFRVFDHLIVGYLNTDPEGYADEIRSALNHLESEVPDGGSSRYLLLARRRWLASELGNLDEAEEHARSGLALAACDSDHWTAASHSVFCFSHLCHSVFLRGSPGLEEFATEGERLAAHTGHRLEHSEFQVWQALIARRQGEEAAARRLAHAARTRVGRIGMPPDHIYFDALEAYHLAGGETAIALAVRERELLLLQGRDRHVSEVRCRVQRCRLLRLQGQLCEAEIENTRKAISRLRRPARWMTQLDALVGDRP